MQNQPKSKYTIKIENFPLAKDFPVHFFTYSPKTKNIHNLHVHNFLEIGYCLDGAGIFIINEKIIPFYKGDTFIVFKNQLHKAQSKTKDSSWHFIYVDVEKLLNNLPLEELLKVMPIINNKADYYNLIEAGSQSNIPNTILEIVKELEYKDNNYKSCIKSLVWNLLLKIDRELRPKDHQSLEKPARDFQKLAPALEYISKHYQSDLSISEVADECYMSLTTLRREFARNINMSPLEYITTTRIKAAMIMIKTTSKSISEIAYEVGFKSLSSFNRYFKKIIGCSPTQYKKTII